MSKISQSALSGVVMVHCYLKLCAKCVPKQLTDVHEIHQMKCMFNLWMLESFPNISKKFKQTLSKRKRITTIVWNCRWLLLLEFLNSGTTITKAMHCNTLERLRRVIKNKRRNMFSSETDFFMITPSNREQQNKCSKNQAVENHCDTYMGLWWKMKFLYE